MKRRQGEKSKDDERRGWGVIRDFKKKKQRSRMSGTKEDGCLKNGK